MRLCAWPRARRFCRPATNCAVLSWGRTAGEALSQIGFSECCQGNERFHVKVARRLLRKEAQDPALKLDYKDAFEAFRLD